MFKMTLEKDTIYVDGSTYRDPTICSQLFGWMDVIEAARIEMKQDKQIHRTKKKKIVGEEKEKRV